jgi:hypothetical protein
MNNSKLVNFILGVAISGVIMNFIYPTITKAKLSQGMTFAISVSVYLLIYAMVMYAMEALSKRVQQTGEDTSDPTDNTDFVNSNYGN